MARRLSFRVTRWLSVGGLVVALAAAWGLMALPDQAAGDHPGGGGRPFATILTGEAEVPGPGHAEAVGTAFVRLNPGQGEVCFFIQFEGIDPDDPDDLIRAGHIHIGGPDVAGPVVVNFNLEAQLPLPMDEEGRGSVAGCVRANRDVIKAIIKNPEGYYVNLHSANFPPGAIRGQLSK